jgi:uncharacterized protein
MRPKPPGLSDEEIDVVQNFLDTIPNAMNFEHLDGFFCALISGPEPVPSNEYLSYIFGGELPRFQSTQQAEEIMSLLAKHWKHVDDSLAKETVYYPFLYADKDGKCSANQWADAFMLGVQLREASWAELLEDTREDALLAQIIALRNELTDVSQGNPDGVIDSEQREELVKRLVVSLQVIYQRYAEQRARHTAQPLH